MESSGLMGFLIKTVDWRATAISLCVCPEEWIREHRRVEIPFVGAILQSRRRPRRRWWSDGALGLVRNPAPN